ncbi:MAG: small multi-drug export protein [Candidatus Doudnabacteria bacterium]|nr:small multi-drug export protein [Candidatus Doudnabacteria bacterium]
MELFILNKELSVVLTGALPIFEIRGALPLALFYYNLPTWEAYALSVLGNCLPIIPVLFGLNKFSEYLMRKSYYINKFLSWLFERTRRQHGGHFGSYKLAVIALFVFVAIPLPLTGVWSGIVAAVVFGIPFWRAVAALALGVMVSGGLVLGLIQLGFGVGKFI